MNADFEHDDLDSLLRPRHPATGHQALRTAILNQTVSVVRFRRRMRRAKLTLALAACYVAGVVSMYFLRSHPTLEVLPPLALEPAPVQMQDPARPGKIIVESHAPPIELDSEVPPPVLERLAMQLKDKRFFFFRAAGDRYLARDNNLEAAIRCYKAALDACERDELTISTEDSWLLMSLKKARLEEKQNAKIQG